MIFVGGSHDEYFSTFLFYGVFDDESITAGGVKEFYKAMTQTRI